MMVNNEWNNEKVLDKIRIEDEIFKKIFLT